MSQKIDGNLQVPQALRSVTTPANKPGVSTDAAARPVEAADSLRLTGEAANLQAVQRDVAARPAFDEARVQALRESIASGSYKIDAEAIATRMLDLDARLAG